MRLAIALFGRPESFFVGPHHEVAALRVDEMGKGEAKAELRGKEAAVVRGAEQPDLGHGLAAWLQAHAALGVVLGERTVQVADQLPDLLRKLLGIWKPAAADRARGACIPAGSAADAEVDAARIERLQHAKGLRDLEGAVVGEQDTAGADADGPRLGPQPREQNLRAGVAERGYGMVLGQPVAAVAELLDPAGEL